MWAPEQVEVVARGRRPGPEVVDRVPEEQDGRVEVKAPGIWGPHVEDPGWGARKHEYSGREVL
eukprot:9244574-Lingulodinium_polyedra.AAC.1